MILRKFNRQPQSRKELEFARNRAIDLKNMREVLMQKYELLGRIENYYPILN